MNGVDFGVFTTGILSIDNMVLQITENVKYDVNVYPNPASNVLNIQNNSSENLRVEIVTIDGKIIYSENLMEGINKILTDEIIGGVYFIKIGYVDVRKIIIQK